MPFVQVSSCLCFLVFARRRSVLIVVIREAQVLKKSFRSNRGLSGYRGLTADQRTYGARLLNLNKCILPEKYSSLSGQLFIELKPMN